MNCNKKKMPDSLVHMPISVLPCFFRILEKNHVQKTGGIYRKKKILYEHQYGFRNNRSTNMAIVELIDKIKRAIENNEYTIWYFLYLSKAFDTVDHGILL